MFYCKFAATNLSNKTKNNTMYKCSECNGLYSHSEENINLLPVEHIIRCPHCKDESHVIGADIDHDMPGNSDKSAYLMYGRDRKTSDNLVIVEGSIFRIVPHK